MPLLCALVAAILAPVLSAVAFVANIVVPAQEKRFRVEAAIMLDGAEHRARARKIPYVNLIMTR